jgi:hypothetical protein
MMPNVLTLAWPVYQALRKHPLVIDRVKYTMQADCQEHHPGTARGGIRRRARGRRQVGLQQRQ